MNKLPLLSSSFRHPLLALDPLLLPNCFYQVISRTWYLFFEYQRIQLIQLFLQLLVVEWLSEHLSLHLLPLFLLLYALINGLEVLERGLLLQLAEHLVALLHGLVYLHIHGRTLDVPD